MRGIYCYQPRENSLHDQSAISSLQKVQNSETTGVKYEDVIIINSLMDDIDTNKFIPILRKGSYKDSFSPLLSHRKGLDFSNDGMFDDKIKELLDALKLEE